MKPAQRYDLEILSHIEENPDTTQADLATRLDVAVGSVNWYIKRLINKGYVKVTRMQRRRLRYLLTPQGITEKTRLTGEFMKASLKWYRVTRQDTQQFLQEVEEAGFDTICIQGDGDLAEIIYLTCLEQGIKVKPELDQSYPIFRVENFKTLVNWPNQSN